MADIHCGLTKLRCEVASDLENYGFKFPCEGIIHLVLDAPLGWALWALENLSLEPSIVISDNPCPEYRRDLKERQPIALLGEVSISDIALVLGGYKPILEIDSYTPLSKAERLTLYLVATDYSNRHIALQRKVSEQTVKNTLGSIYEKLHLKTRVQASHYYFGNWHLLLQRGWMPPGHLSVPSVMKCPKLRPPDEKVTKVL